MLRPNTSHWLQLAIATLTFAVAASSFGIATGLFRFELASDLAGILRIAAIALLLPALFEELVFRGPLIWLANRNRRYVPAAIAISLIAFVLWHPLNGSFLMTDARDLFTDWRFLVIAAGLGSVATWLALQTRRIWPPVIFHWVSVAGWKVFLGGPGFL